MDSAFKVFLETECDAHFITDGVKDGLGIEGYNMFWTFSSEKPAEELKTLILERYVPVMLIEDNTPGAFFLNNVDLYRVVHTNKHPRTDYIVYFEVRANV